MGERGFRGFTAPASLKPVMGVKATLNVLARFPGLYRPGLIEAGSCGCATPSGRARFPGLYRPGLIEAG